MRRFIITVLLAVLAMPCWAAEKVDHQTVGDGIVAAAKAADHIASPLSALAAKKAEQYLNALEDATKHYAPAVVDGALTVVRINGFNQIALPFVWLMIGLLAFPFIRFVVRPWGERERAASDGLSVIIYCSLIICDASIVIIALITMFSNVWPWIAIFDPKLYLAYLIFGKVF